jgi:hypothetical protein
MKNSRRLFLKKIGITTLTIFATPIVLEAKNTELNNLTAFCYALYPQKGLNLKYYEKCALSLLSDTKNHKMISKGVNRLNKLFNKPFSELNYIDQKRAISYISSVNDQFFSHVRAYLITGLYGNKQTWPHFGYEGESFSKGGYVDRGFDDISWIQG